MDLVAALDLTLLLNRWWSLDRRKGGRARCGFLHKLVLAVAFEGRALPRTRMLLMIIHS